MQAASVQVDGVVEVFEAVRRRLVQMFPVMPVPKNICVLTTRKESYALCFNEDDFAIKIWRIPQKSSLVLILMHFFFRMDLH